MPVAPATAAANAFGLQLPEATDLLIALRSAETQISALPREVALAFTDNGQLQLFKVGEVSKVMFTDAEMVQLTGAYFTHNHPSQSFLTVHDVGFACDHDLAQLRAVAGTVVHVLTRPATGWPLGYCRQLIATEQNRFRKRFDFPGADRAQALRQWNAFAHKLIERLSLTLSQEML